MFALISVVAKLFNETKMIVPMFHLKNYQMDLH
jgi:hypothetical protein